MTATGAAKAGLFEPHWAQRPGAKVARVHRPRSLHNALELLADDPSRRLVAGGTDLVVELDRAPGPAVELIDTSCISGAGSIEFTEIDGRVHALLGHGVTHNQVIATPSLVEGALPLAQACLEIGSPQLRNRATVAGNVATASPANDSISALVSLDARVQLVGLHGGSSAERSLRVADFFTGVRSTVLAPGEMIAGISVPLLGERQAGVWVKAGLRKAQAISVVHAGLVLEFEDIDRGSPVVAARVALGSVAPTVALSSATAEALVGQSLTPATINDAADAAAASVDPIDDGRATADYRSATVATVVRRSLQSLAAQRERDHWPIRVPTLGTVSPATPPPAATIDEQAEISVTINGAATTGPGAASQNLLDWLREHAGTGTKEGCAEGECGACTVMLDGAAVMSCLTPAAQADGGDVLTVEGLASPGSLSAMQQSFVDNFAVQCGYCIPGFVVSATALRAEIDDPTRDEIELALSGNLCRCTGYYAILEAVRAAGGIA